MSLFRVGILVAAVVAVLPADRQQQAHLYDRAASAVHWTATFCDRNGQTCAQAASLWSAFLTKAQFGAQMPTRSPGERPRASAARTALVIRVSSSRITPAASSLPISRTATGQTR